MKLAVSNIAWEVHDDPQILDLLKKYGVQGIEVAPTKIWPHWEGASLSAAENYRREMEDSGFEIPAMQALLFGKPDLQVFDKSTYHDFYEHIRLLSEIASGFQCKVLVFGSPKNRRRGQLSVSEANKIAREFFYTAAEICCKNDCSIGLEHNPVEYGCDYINNVMDARELVDSLNHPGFQLHLDSAGVSMCGGNISEIIKKAGDFIHYHISEPMLEPIINGSCNHRQALNSLKEMNYNKWISIEMKQPQNIHLLSESLQFVNTILAKSDLE